MEDNNNNLKKCNICNNFLITACFYKDKTRKNGFYPNCKKCESKRKKDSRDSDSTWIEKHSIKGKEWYEKNKIAKRLKNKEWRDINLRRRFNITLDKYNQMLENQEYYCHICGNHQDDETQFFNIDHDHKTGGIRGLLCGKCNRGLGMFNDSIDSLKKAISYIQKYEK